MKMSKKGWMVLFALGILSCNLQPDIRNSAPKENSSPPLRRPPLFERVEPSKRLYPLSTYAKGVVEVKNKRVSVYLADNPQKMQEGLMFIKANELKPDEGMLFIFPDDEIRSFWMKNTEIPLDIAFLDKKGKIVRIRTMRPYDESSYSSDYPARYALELHGGWLEKNGVKEGDKVKLIKIR